jgi:DNA polymerase-3 subunit delta'
LQHIEDNWDAMLREWMNSILKYGPAAQVKWVEDISKIGREKQKQVLKYFIQVIEHAIRIKILGITTESTLDDFAGKLNKICQIPQLEAITEELNKASYHIERNANAKILFHALTIRIYHIISNKSVILIQ